MLLLRGELNTYLNTHSLVLQEAPTSINTQCSPAPNNFGGASRLDTITPDWTPSLSSHKKHLEHIEIEQLLSLLNASRIHVNTSVYTKWQFYCVKYHFLTQIAKEPVLVHLEI